MTAATVSFQPGYIVSQRGDLVWFVLLPFAALAAALVSQQYLPSLAMVAISFVVTAPHHCVTFLRVYASPNEFQSRRFTFVAGPLLFIPAVFFAAKFAPFSLMMLIMFWDHQHSIMQQYGFTRIYDFKAGTGSPRTAKLDFYLNWVLFVNMLLVSKAFAAFWIRLFLGTPYPLDYTMFGYVYQVSWIVTAAYVAFYAGDVISRVRDGHPVNVSKYLFLFSSYFLWYFLSFSTTSLIVWGIGHRIMHGVQYIVMVYYYNRNNVARTGGDSSLLAYLGKPGATHIMAFLIFILAYGVVFWQLTLERQFSPDYDIFAASLISSFSLLHYYYDAFIWKIRRAAVQENL